MSATNRELWRIVRQPSGTVEPDLYDLQTAKAYNRYASNFVATMDDPDGTKADDYPRGQRAQAQYSTDGGTTWTTKQAGFVQKVNDGENVGTGQFEALFIGYDHFLRREPVYETFSGVTVSSALQTVIEDYTPVNYVAGNVTVANDETVTREFVGERPDEVISWLAAVSGEEEYGVNDSFEFFFRPRVTESAPGNILNGEWFEYSLPTEGRHAVNSVRVFYGDGAAIPRSSVIVEDRVEQRDLATQLAAPRRVVLGDDVHYPEITDRAAARAKGQERLENRSPVLTGEVSTFQRYDWEPGEVFRLEIPEKGIDTTFAIAEIRHHWRRAETTVKVAQNTGNVADLLNSLSDDVTRVDLRDSDPAGPRTNYLDLRLGATVSIEAEARQRGIAGTSFVAGINSIGDKAGITLTDDTGTDPQAGFDFNFGTSTGGTGAATTAAINQFRDVWQGAGPATVDQFKAGTGTSEAVQTDTDLHNDVTGLQAVDQLVASGDYSITFEASIAAGGAFAGTEFTEFGFFQSDGTMHNRATLEQGITHTNETETKFFITFTIDTDPDRVGVVTNTGQRRLRDMYLGDVAASTYGTTDRAYGTGTTMETESDTALATRVGEKALTHEDAGTATDRSTMELLTSEANTNDLAEFGDENGANELMSRVTFEPITKTSDFALVSVFDLRIRPVIL